MKWLINILFFFLSFVLFNKVQGQTNKLFSQHEIDSINFYYTPLYPTDSVDIAQSLNSQYINIYYFNGDCSICIDKMTKAEAFYEEHKNEYFKTIFIVETGDTILFNYYRDKLNIDTKILWDKNYRLSNQTINTCFLTNKSGNIIIEGDFIEDGKMQKKYIDTLKHLTSNN